MVLNLQDLLLQKEELPISQNNHFEVPIHPRLLELETIDSNLALEAFREAVPDWYADLTEYQKKAEPEVADWLARVYLKGEPKVTYEGSSILSLEGLSWKTGVDYLDNGFARLFSISRNTGGTLYFDKGEVHCRTYVPVRDEHRGYVRFSAEKVRSFSYEVHKREDGGFSGEVYRYAHHNIDQLPGALFLRNWGIKYMNKILPRVI